MEIHDRTQLNTPVPKDLYDKVDQAAKSRIVSKAVIVREALLAFFAGKERGS